MSTRGETERSESSRTSEHQPEHTTRRHRLSRQRTLGGAVALLVPVLGLAVAACGGSAGAGTASTSSTSSTSTAVAGVGSGGFAGHGGSSGGTNARTTNAAGGSVGTISGVSSSGFTLSTPTGEKVTVKTTSTTVYEKRSKKAAASAVVKGTTALALGKVSSTTITASEVIVQPAINLSKAASKVISFSSGTQGTSKSVGQIPSSYKQGSGTLVSGTTAAKATEAALSSYAGGIVDRVVRLSNGDYEVHTIGVNWPHHVFVNKDFHVVGAND
jgi:hypothetical protein